MLTEHKFIVFGSAPYNTLGAVRSLGEAGICPDVILHPRYRSNPIFTNNSKYVRQVHVVNTVEDGYSLLLNLYGKEQLKPFVYACDDWVESILDLHYNDIKNRFIFFHGKEQGIVSRYMDKDAISNLAKENGLKIPKAELVRKGEMTKALNFPIITKSRNSTNGGWKEDVYICKSEDELRNVYSKISSNEILLAEYIDKEEEFSFDAFSLYGGNTVVMPYTITCLRATPGNYGKYLQYSSVVDKNIEKSITRMLTTIGFTGLFSADFLKGKDGKYYFLEINFRNSAFSYPVTFGGINMLYLWAKGMVMEGDFNYEYKYNEFKALVEIQDFKDYVMTHKCSFLKWLYELTTADCLFYINKNDMKPVYAHVKYIVKKIFRKIF